MNIDSGTLQTVVTFLVSGSVVTLVTYAWRAWGSLRSGARANTRAVIKDLADDRAAAERAREHQTRLTEFWRAVAANYSYQLRTNGITPDPETPIPPREAVREDSKARRKVKEMEDTLTDMGLDE